MFDYGLTQIKWRASDHTRKRCCSTGTNFMLRILEHTCYTVEEFLLALLRQQEETSEKNYLHVDHNSQPLVPGLRCSSNTNQRINQLLVLASAMWNIREMAENVVCQGLQLWVFLDVHHVQELFCEDVWEEVEKLGAFV